MYNSVNIEYCANRCLIRFCLEFKFEFKFEFEFNFEFEFGDQDGDHLLLRTCATGATQAHVVV